MLLEKDSRIAAAPASTSAEQPDAAGACDPAVLTGPILIVADDLTGACDSAVCFVAAGREVRVALRGGEAGAWGHSGDSTVLAVSTESRGVGEEAAAAEVMRRLAEIDRGSASRVLFKKIDSAARGPIAAETDAALRASGAAIALVTPALPSERRTVAGGVLSVRDWAGQDTMIDLREVFAGRAGVSVFPVASEELLFRELERAVAAGERILLCDAIEQADLDRLVSAGLRLGQPVLWAGSAGMARALAQHILPTPRTAGAPMRRSGRAMLFTGTAHSVTALQIDHLERASSGSRPRAVCRLPERGASGEAVVSAFSAEGPAALILTGGDTASFVLNALGAESIWLAGEIASGIPWGLIAGGLADGCMVVTKSGGFGERDALLRAFQFCESDVGSLP